ncbi:MAG: methionyl-tRNA formyltransferase [Sphingobacteriales bacterium]|nr:MAG: methionyl-tRNA formyltransferase [Sphingobacteriales bacterium]
MHTNDLRIVFMGTPEFAVPSLDILIKNKYNVVGVVTATDKPAGRGNNIQQSAVKKYALENNLHILQPEKLKSAEFINELKSLDANLFIVVAFRMLPEVVWQMPSLGTFNLHASLLPQYRGAAPINWAVINGDTETGATTFFLQHEIDTGNIILQDKIEIKDDDNAGAVHDKLMILGSNLVLKTVKIIAENNVTQKPQIINSELQNLKHAPKLFKETCLIDWNKPANEVHNLIRGLSPYPAAYTFLDNKILKIYQSKISDRIGDQAIISDNKTYLSFKCNDTYLDVLELQLEGKKRIKIDEFLRGYKISN